MSIINAFLKVEDARQSQRVSEKGLSWYAGEVGGDREGDNEVDRGRGDRWSERFIGVLMTC